MLLKTNYSVRTNHCLTYALWLSSKKRVFKEQDRRGEFSKKSSDFIEVNNYQ